MKIRKLKLYTNKIKAELDFYSQTLGFEILHHSPTQFTAKIGWTELTFEKANEPHIYHYCFLIPSNHLHQALIWMQQKTEIIISKEGETIQHYEDWNADSFYFYDASGNVAECIVHYDLENREEEDFDITKILCVNEMGMPTNNIKETNRQLVQEIESTFWKGDQIRFGANGSLEGLFLLPNYEVKETWYPSTTKIELPPYQAVVENKLKWFNITYNNGQFTSEQIQK